MARSSHAKAFMANLRQGDMPARTWLGKFLRNRFRATVLLKGCCGNPGEPGC